MSLVMVSREQMPAPHMQTAPEAPEPVVAVTDDEVALFDTVVLDSIRLGHGSMESVARATDIIKARRMLARLVTV